jgi:hypothetical protein
MLRYNLSESITRLRTADPPIASRLLIGITSTLLSCVRSETLSNGFLHLFPFSSCRWVLGDDSSGLFSNGAELLLENTGGTRFGILTAVRRWWWFVLWSSWSADGLCHRSSGGGLRSDDAVWSG